MKQIGLRCQGCLQPLRADLPVHSNGVWNRRVLSTPVWSMSILPYLDQANTFNLYNQNFSAFESVNATAITQASGYICPTTRSTNQVNYTIPAHGLVIAQRSRLYDGLRGHRQRRGIGLYRREPG
ncbi:MAG: hypothetical protein U0872_05305 [Planctomycetaceae bacterium]